MVYTLSTRFLHSNFQTFNNKDEQKGWRGVSLTNASLHVVFTSWSPVEKDGDSRRGDNGLYLISPGITETHLHNMVEEPPIKGVEDFIQIDFEENQLGFAAFGPSRYFIDH